MAGGKKRRRVFDLPPDEDVRREVRFHIESKVEELMEEGWTEDAARQEAERRFGDRLSVEDEATRITERHRRSRQRASRLETIWQDVRFGLRTLIRRPAFTVVAALTLGLGVGANAAIFSVIQRLLIAPLPFGDGDRLVRLWEVGENGGEIAFAEANFDDVRDRMRTLEFIAWHPTFWFGGPTTILGGSRPVQRTVAGVSAEFFDVIDVAPELGRVPAADEADAGAAPVAVVSHAFWADLLGGERDLSRLTIEIGQTRFAVVGVMPRGWDYPGGSAVWIPSAGNGNPHRTSHNYAVIARLRDGSTIADAQREATSIARSLRAEYGEAMSAVDFRVRPLREELYGDFRGPLYILLGAAGLVLLLACTNLASTMLARASTRAQEFTVRSALGASRARVVRQLFTESLLLALIGAAVGSAFAALSLRGIAAVAPADALRNGDFGLGAGVLGFALAVSVAAALLFGLLPALRATRGNLATTLREGGRGGTGRARIWDALVITEAALAIVLLVSSGLLLRAFRGTLEADPGFDAAGVIVADLPLPASRYPTDTTVAVLHGRLLTAVRALPGIESAGLISQIPFGGMNINGGVDIVGAPDAGAYADYRAVTEGYFETLHIPVLRGRTFGPQDRLDTDNVVVVSRSFADRFLPGEEAVGRQVRNLRNDSGYYGEDQALTIVGVVEDVAHRGFLAPPSPTVYVCGCQRAYRMSSSSLVVRATGPTAAVVGRLRATLASVEPEMPVEFTTLPALMRTTVADRRFSLIILGVFAGVAVLLAAVGIYGVVSYAVARRRREMGIRLALGAQPGGVQSMMVRSAMIVVLAGIVLGVLGAAAASRLIAAQLAGAEGFDPVTVAATAGVLLFVAFLASWIPARRLIRVDPLHALRSE